VAGRGLSADWRVDSRESRDWHDRWIADDKGAWNVPPVNTLFKNDYSEIVPVMERPPLRTGGRAGSRAPEIAVLIPIPGPPGPALLVGNVRRTGRDWP
jgi:hypothetical protein